MKYPIPRGKKRACLCRDGFTYSIDCCKEDYFAQGIGSVTMGDTDSGGTVTNVDTSSTTVTYNPPTTTTTTTTTTLPVFGCSDASFSISDGETGATTTGQGSVTLGTISSISPSTYSSGSATYTASITVPSGYSNQGATITCTDTATGTESFDCTDAGFVMSDGTTGATTSGQGTVLLGTINSITPTTYTSGSATYTANILVPSGYFNTGSNIDCTDTATGLDTFTCTNANFNMANGNVGDSTTGQGTVSLGTITAISPATYTSGTATYTATITVPSGYSNSGQSITCTDTAEGASFGWFANANSESDGFSTRSDACSGSFADTTSVRIHFKNGSGVLQYPTTTQDIIDGSITGSGTTLLMFEDDGTGSPTTNEIRGGATFFGLVYKDVDDRTVATDPQLTLIALGSSTDSPPYNAEGTYSSVQSCSS